MRGEDLGTGEDVVGDLVRKVRQLGGVADDPNCAEDEVNIGDADGSSIEGGLH